MTDELKQEAEEWVEKNFCPHCFHKDIADCEGFDLCGVSKIYLASAEPREKRIAELTDKIKTLEEALEGYKKIAKWCDNCEQKKELEKEIAELKKRHTDLCYACQSYYQHKELYHLPETEGDRRRPRRNLPRLRLFLRRPV